MLQEMVKDTNSCSQAFLPFISHSLGGKNYLHQNSKQTKGQNYLNYFFMIQVQSN